MKKAVWSVAALLIVALVAAACGGAGGSAPAAQPTTASKPAAPAPTTAPAAPAPTTAPTTAPAAAAPKATDAPKAAATTAPAAAPAGATPAVKAPANTPAPTRAPEEGPAGLKIGQGVKSAADVEKIDLSGKQVEVIFWHVFSSNQERALKQIAADFEKANPSIKVTLVYKGSYDPTRKATLTAIAANAVPDLVWSFPNAVGEYAREDVVQPLDPFIQSSKYGLGDLAKNLDAALLESYKYPDFGNQTLSLPPAVSADVMYYNIDMLKQLGYSNPPATVQQFMEICAKIKTQMPDKFCTALIPEASRFASWVFNRGGSLLSADGKSAAFREPGLATLQMYKELFDKGYAYQPAQAFGDQADFGVGKVLFTFGSTAGIPFYRDSILDKTSSKPRFEWSIAPYPHSTPKPVVNVFGPSVALLKTTPERSLAAWQFLKFWMSAAQSGTWATTANYYPVNKEANASPAIKTYMEANPVFAKGFDLLQYAKSEPSNPGWQAARDAIANGVTSVITNKATPEQAIDAMVKAVNDVLKQ